MKNFFLDFFETLRNNILFTVLSFLAVIIIISIGWSYYTAEYTTKDIYSLNERAQRNKLYASELLLKQSNKDAHVKTQMDMDLNELVVALDGIKAGKNYQPTLIITKVNANISERKIKHIYKWIESGGHLITFHKNTLEQKQWEELSDYFQKDSKKDTKQVEILRDVHKRNRSNGLLNRLNIYKVDVKKNKSEHITIETKKQAIDFYKKIGIPIPAEFSTRHIKTDTKEPKKSKAESEPKDVLLVDSTKISQNIQRLMRVPKYVLLHDSDETPILLKESANSEFKTEWFFKNNPQAKPYTKSDVPLQSVTVKQLRHYLNNQLKQLKNNTIKFSILPKNQQAELRQLMIFKSFYMTMNSLEAKVFLESLLTLTDTQLMSCFSSKKNVLFDSHFGDGRITVLSDNITFSNPTKNNVRSRSENQQANLTITKFLDGAEESYESSILESDNASLLLNLTSNSDETWLFSRVDIDSLPLLLWKKAKIAVLGLFLFLIIWLWSLYNRFGKNLVLSNKHQFDIFRYFRQVGRYGWDYDNAKNLSKTTRIHVHKLINRALVVQKVNNSSTAISSNLSDIQLKKLVDVLHTRLHQHIQKNSQNTSAHVDALSKNGLFETVLSDKALKEQGLAEYLQTNKNYMFELLTKENLQKALYPTAIYSEEIQASEFVSDTQTLWLVQWLLK